MKTATAKDLVAAFAFYRQHPNGKLRVDWCTTWNHQDFLRWFRDCLARKINRNDTRKGRRLNEEYQTSLLLDSALIREHFKGVRRSGRNLLRNPDMRARFPQINTRDSTAD